MTKSPAQYMTRLFIAATILLATTGIAGGANNAPVLNPIPSPSFRIPIPEDAGAPNGRVGTSVEALVLQSSRLRC